MRSSVRLRRFDQLPELRILLEGFIFLDREGGAVKEVFESVPAQDPVDDQTEFVALEINAIIANAEAMKDLASAFQLAESLQVGAHYLLGKAAKFTQNVQLKFLGHAGQFGCTSRVEDNLKRAHPRKI